MIEDKKELKVIQQFMGHPTHCVVEDKTMDHNYYIEDCLESVVKEIWEERRSAGTKWMKLLEDNARICNDKRVEPIDARTMFIDKQEGAAYHQPR